MSMPATLGTSIIILLGSITTTHADHRRQLDDLAFAVLSDARDIRWAVRDHFTQSRNLRYLCRESDDIFATARNLQDAIFRGRTLPIICNNIDKVQVELCEFEELLQRSELGRHASNRFPSHHHGDSRDGGYEPLQLMQQRVAQLKQTLNAMHAIADGHGVVVPQPPIFVDPPLPTMPTPPGPLLPSPLSRKPPHHRPHATQVSSPTLTIGGLKVSLGI